MKIIDLLSVVLTTIKDIIQKSGSISPGIRGVQSMISIMQDACFFMAKLSAVEEERNLRVIVDKSLKSTIQCAKLQS